MYSKVTENISYSDKLLNYSVTKRDIDDARKYQHQQIVGTNGADEDSLSVRIGGEEGYQ